MQCVMYPNPVPLRSLHPESSVQAPVSGERKRKAATNERKTHSTPAFEAYVRAFAAVRGHLTISGRRSSLAEGPPAAWDLCLHCMTKFCGVSLSWWYHVSSRSRESRMEQLGFGRAGDGHMKRTLAAHHCCEGAKECCVLTDAEFDPVTSLVKVHHGLEPYTLHHTHSTANSALHELCSPAVPGTTLGCLVVPGSPPLTTPPPLIATRGGTHGI